MIGRRSSTHSAKECYYNRRLDIIEFSQLNSNFVNLLFAHKHPKPIKSGRVGLKKECTVQNTQNLEE